MENFMRKFTENKIILKNCNKEEQYKNLSQIYKFILFYLYSDENITDIKLKNFEDEFVEVGNKENEEVLKEIREDILREIKKEINFYLFENVDY